MKFETPPISETSFQKIEKKILPLSSGLEVIRDYSFDQRWDHADELGLELFDIKSVLLEEGKEVAGFKESIELFKIGVVGVYSDWKDSLGEYIPSIERLNANNTSPEGVSFTWECYCAWDKKVLDSIEKISPRLLSSSVRSLSHAFPFSRVTWNENEIEIRVGMCDDDSNLIFWRKNKKSLPACLERMQSLRNSVSSWSSGQYVSDQLGEEYVSMTVPRSTIASNIETIVKEALAHCFQEKCFYMESFYLFLDNNDWHDEQKLKYYCDLLAYLPEKYRCWSINGPGRFFMTGQQLFDSRNEISRHTSIDIQGVLIPLCSVNMGKNDIVVSKIYEDGSPKFLIDDLRGRQISAKTILEMEKLLELKLSKFQKQKK